MLSAHSFEGDSGLDSETHTEANNSTASAQPPMAFRRRSSAASLASVGSDPMRTTTRVGSSSHGTWVPPYAAAAAAPPPPPPPPMQLPAPLPAAAPVSTHYSVAPIHSQAQSIRQKPAWDTAASPGSAPQLQQYPNTLQAQYPVPSQAQPQSPQAPGHAQQSQQSQQPQPQQAPYFRGSFSEYTEYDQRYAPYYYKPAYPGWGPPQPLPPPPPPAQQQSQQHQPPAQQQSQQHQPPYQQQPQPHPQQQQQHHHHLQQQHPYHAAAWNPYQVPSHAFGTHHVPNQQQQQPQQQQQQHTPQTQPQPQSQPQSQLQQAPTPYKQTYNQGFAPASDRPQMQPQPQRWATEMPQSAYMPDPQHIGALAARQYAGGYGSGSAAGPDSGPVALLAPMSNGPFGMGLVPPAAYRCSMCDKSFKRRSWHKRHLLSHSSFKPYSCPWCQSRHKRRDNLFQHMKTKHVRHVVQELLEVGDVDGSVVSGMQVTSDESAPEPSIKTLIQDGQVKKERVKAVLNAVIARVNGEINEP